MSQFSRTNSGVSNLHLFHSVDFLVFTEGGGRNVPIREAFSGIDNFAPTDKKFWSLVLRGNGVNKSFSVKAIGSKSAVMEVAKKIELGDIKNVIAAMDRDFDDYMGELIYSPLVLYTDGYSWESDVYTKELTKEQLSSFLFIDSLTPEVEKEVESAYGAFENIGARLARVEMIFREQGVPWISEARGEKFFRPEKKGIIDRQNLRKSIRERKSSIQRPVSSPVPGSMALNPYKVTCGKLLRALSVSVMRYLGKKYGNCSTLPNDVIAAVMLDRFGSSDSHVRSEYYARAVASLVSVLK